VERVGPDDIPVPVREMCRTFARHGHRGWLVGGCLRDLLRGHTPSDWDLATDATPSQVQAIFPRVIPTGVQHGTVTVRHRGASYEVTTLRGEGAYSDGRRPDRVQFVTDIEQDLARRDFTINALAYDPVQDALVDPFDGLGDLERGLIRAVGEPARRFGEDGLRVLRAARFAATLEFALDGPTEQAIGATLETFRKVSAERVREEWVKALGARSPSRAFVIMRRTGLLGAIHAGLSELGVEPFERTMQGVDSAPRDLCMRLAALLFPVRDDLEGAADWLTRYRFSNSERERVVRMLAFAARPVADEDLAVRRYAQQVGRASLAEVLELGTLLARAHHGEGSPEARAASALEERCHRLITPATPLHTRELAIGGRDLMAELSIAPGPEVGKLLDRLLERALERPALNTREALLAEARVIRKE
jgi:tRNA nucleotidyltransferase (CCA-adding enzyme)